MDYPPFYRTRRGEVFFGKHVPDLIRQLGRLNDLLERLVAQRECVGQDDNDADA